MCLYVYIEKKNMIYTCWHPKFKKGKPKLVTLGQKGHAAMAPQNFQKKNIYIYKTEAFETFTIFYVSTTLKK